MVGTNLRDDELRLIAKKTLSDAATRAREAAAAGPPPLIISISSTSDRKPNPPHVSSPDSSPTSDADKLDIHAFARVATSRVSDVRVLILFLDFR